MCVRVSGLCVGFLPDVVPAVVHLCSAGALSFAAFAVAHVKLVTPHAELALAFAKVRDNQRGVSGAGKRYPTQEGAPARKRAAAPSQGGRVTDCRSLRTLLHGAPLNGCGEITIDRTIRFLRWMWPRPARRCALQLAHLHGLTGSAMWLAVAARPQVPRDAYLVPAVAFTTAFVLNALKLLVDWGTPRVQFSLIACYIAALAAFAEYVHLSGASPIVRDAFGQGLDVLRQVRVPPGQRAPACSFSLLTRALRRRAVR